MLHDNNLIEMSLRLNRSKPLFGAIRKLPGIGKRPRKRQYTNKFHGRTAKANTNFYI